MRQTEPQGVVTRWVIAPLDIDPFNLPSRYSLQRKGKLSAFLGLRDTISIGAKSVHITTQCFNRTVSRKRLNVKDFRGIALRVSVLDQEQRIIAVSINLHHNELKYCFPLHLAYDTDISGARLQTWARELHLPVLLPTVDGTWIEPVETLGRLAIKPVIHRPARLQLKNRKPVLPTYRETCKLDPQKKVTGREMIAWD